MMNALGALWVDASEAAGSIAAALGLFGGVAIALLYGRKATAQVAAEAYLANGSVLLSTRPSICAVGLFRLKFTGDDGATVRVTEMVQIEYDLRDGRHWDAEAIFGESFVEGGETLTTTVIFPLGPLPVEVVGWRVSFGVTVQRWPSGQRWSWADQVFVPRPAGTIDGSKEKPHGQGPKAGSHTNDDQSRGA